jgi:adenine-specific DNA-methyltransferase
MLTKEAAFCSLFFFGANQLNTPQEYPACGSGAFPMGVLQKLVLILEKVDPGSEKWLEKFLEKVPYAFRKQVRQALEKENVDYIHKMGLIRRAIYGVDVQQIAVEISKLRVFLALVVDAGVEESADNRGIKPLPNLEFKFVCADSLVRLPEDRKTLSGGLFEARKEIKQLKDLREQYFDSYGREKEEIKAAFKQTQDQMFKQMLEKSGENHYGARETAALSAWKPFENVSSDWFEPDWMFGVKSGFDIVISNPPYIRQEMLREKKGYYKEHYQQVYHGVADIYVYFIEKGMAILKEKGPIV